jgi:hypothetical protein
MGARKADYQNLDIASGLFMNETDRGAVNRWKDGDNVRWLNGLPEKIGGYLLQQLTDEDSNVLTYEGKARSALQWDSLDGLNWVSIGTQCKLYLINGSRLYDITPVRRTFARLDPFSVTNTLTTVTVTDANHDAQEGDQVRYTGATAVGGITISGEYTIVSVIDIDTYTITHTAAASSTATGGGAVTMEYDISCGLESDGTLSGYGTGDYGEETYGTERTGSTYRGFARVWSLQQWGEDLLASPSGGALYYWDRSLGPSSRAVLVPNAPANIEHMLVSPDDRHVIAFGANLTSTGEQDKMFIRWCASEDFDTWIAAVDNDAGSKRIDVGSRIITAVRTRTQMLVLTDKALYNGEFIGGDDVFSFNFLAEAMTPVAKGSLIEVNGIGYFMGEDDFYIYDGTLRIMECDISEYVYGSLSRTNQSKVYARYNKEFTEIWWSYPSSGATENDRTAIYNIAEKVWYKSSIQRECGLDRNTFYGKPLAFKDGELFLHENGVNAGTGILTAYLESYEAEIDAGGNQIGLVNHLLHDFKTLTGSVDVRLFGREYPSDSVVNSSTINATSATRKVDIRFSQRQQGIRIESNDLGDHWRMGKWRVMVTPNGTRIG